MKRVPQQQFTRALFLLVWLCLFGGLHTSFAQTTAFTYQGKLTDGGNPANNTYDLQFKLFDTATVSTGTQQGATLVRNPVVVSAGVFTVTLDFGANVFGGPDRYLEIGVRPQGSSNPYTVLAPRQPITSSPYAIQTLNAQQLGGIPASGFLQNTTAQQAGANFNIGGTGTAGSLNILNTISLAGSGAPAVAPAGQTRLYFDSSANKLRVSENGGAYVNLVGATGVSGSGTANTIPLWSAGTTLGSSLMTQSGNSINMPNSVIFGASATGHVAQFGSPNTETGLTFSGGGLRADIRYNGTLKIVNGAAGGPPSGTNGIAIGSSGNVGVGTETPANKLDVNGGIRSFFNNSTGVVAETSGGTNAWARFYAITPNQRWFIGTSQSFNGDQFYLVDDNSGQARMTVQPAGGTISFPLGDVGIGTTNPAAKLHVEGVAELGVLGNSISSSGVRGETAATSPLSPGVRGVSTGVGGVGVRGDGGTGVYGTSTTGTGVTGESTSPNGYGVYASSSAGRAIYAEGNASQARDKGGFVKAMLYINPFLPASQYIVRCYNGITNSSTGNCGFTVTRTDTGKYTINFAFPINDRFFSLTTESAFVTGEVEPIGTNEVYVALYQVPIGVDDFVDQKFYLIVY